MPDFYFNIQTKVHFGIDSVSRIGSLAGSMSGRVLLVTEGILYENKTIERVQDFLEKRGVKYITFDEVVPDATSKTVNNGLKIARISHVDGVIGLGGVKTLSIAKAIAMGSGSTKNMEDFLSGDKPAHNPLPYIEIPTTCRNPFMLTDEYLLTDARNRKGIIRNAQENITRYVIIDPVLSVSLPAKYTSTTMMDTLLAAIEGFCSNSANFYSDLVFSDAIRTLGTLLAAPRENPEDVSRRYNASKAGLLTAMGLTMCKAGIGTGLSWAINAGRMVPKSWVAAILMPHVLEFQAPTCREKLALVSKLLGAETEELPGDEPAQDEAPQSDAAYEAIDLLRRFLGSLNIPTRLADFDLNPDDMMEIAETVYQYEMMKDVPRTCTPDDLLTIIKSAL